MMMSNLKIYQDAQIKLKTLVKNVQLKDATYYSIVKITDDFILWAGIYRDRDCMLRVALYRSFCEDSTPKSVTKRMKYENFVRVFPEFGRRDIWRDDWDTARDRYKKLNPDTDKEK